MNNYSDKECWKLINALLKDGSDQSILKLKMMIEHDCFESMNFNPTKIALENKIAFLNIYKDYYRTKFKLNPQTILTFFYQEIGNFCYSCDGLHANKELIIEIFKMFKEEYAEIFSTFENSLHIIPVVAQIEIFLMFEESFNKLFSSKPLLISEITFENKILIKNLFPNVKWVS